MKKFLNLFLLEVPLIIFVASLAYIIGASHPQHLKLVSYWWVLVYIVVAIVIRHIIFKGKTKVYTQEEYDAKEQFDFDFDKKNKQNEKNNDDYSDAN